MDKREKIREQITDLRKFYIDILNYIIFNIIFISIWLVFDKDNLFWPKYVLLIWGISLVFKASRTGLLPFFINHTGFLGPEWEEKKIQALLATENPPKPTKIPLKRDLPKSSPSPTK